MQPGVQELVSALAIELRFPFIADEPEEHIDGLLVPERRSNGFALWTACVTGSGLVSLHGREGLGGRALGLASLHRKGSGSRLVLLTRAPGVMALVVPSPARWIP